MNRLPPQPHEWINRDQPVSFRFEGDLYHGYQGDVLSSALWAHDVRMIGRSFKYHRPRGIYSLANHDVNGLVEDNPSLHHNSDGGTAPNFTRTNLRADVLRIQQDLDVRAVNTTGGLRRDWLRFTQLFSSFLPVGFYYKAFYTPRVLFPFYERQIRKVAGLGSIHRKNHPQPSPKDYGFCELLVVGAGPAGLAAAVAAAENGVRVLVVDENPHPGGSLNWQWAGEPGSRKHLDKLLDKTRKLANLELRCNTQAGGIYDDHWVGLFDQKRLTKLRTEAVLIATGCFEQPAVFTNNDLPGVMLGSAAQRLIHLYSVKPFDQAIVLAANLDGYRVARDLYHAGVNVAAIADPRPKTEPTELERYVADLGISVYHRHAVFEAVSDRGSHRIKSAVLGSLDEQGRLQSGTKFQMDCDGIAISVGWMPAGGLLYQAGARFTYCDPIEQLVPTKLGDRLLAAGRVRGIHALDDQLEDGRRAGLEAAKTLGQFSGTVPRLKPQDDSPASHPYPIFPNSKKNNFIDLDEDVHLYDLINAHQEGFDNIELLKRYTTFGMGPSQGKLAHMNTVRILAHLNQATINETGTTTSRPFHQPAPLGHLAGRRFHPMRRTPIHAWHGNAGAVFYHAGNWHRPEYYTQKNRDRDDCIIDESLNVRQQVGMIDVGTLGKIQVCGPDAVELLDRIYTGKFAKQPIGRLRYGLALDETGVIIEDGVIARMSEDHFYLTATSSGAAAFFREMQRWALIWNLKVVLSDITGQLGAMNIAGPRCLDVLQSLTNIDLSGPAFPYLGVRTGQVANVPATLMRVGFVGELGFEIHVPARHATRVWESLINAGKGAGIRPFGLEAQRLLRLEKGHIIVSQDTDALTHPFEAQTTWAIGKNKSYFIGQRSLDIVNQQPLARRLVGFKLTKDHQGPMPKECHLIFDADQIVGRVTSFTPQSTLGFPLGLAFLKPDLAELGSKIQIRVDGGTQVQAQIAPLPFYDPDNERQKNT